MNTSFDVLEENIIDMLIEQQLKLGYIKEKVRLYYPVESVQRMLGIRDLDIAILTEFDKKAAASIGEIHTSIAGDRVCFLLSDEVSEYVHLNYTGEMNHREPKVAFLKEFVTLMSSHGVNIQQIENLFRQYSGSVVLEKMDDEEFDFLLYFVDGKPDSYYYCIVDEGCHMTYHRFIKDDYEEMFG